MENKSFTWCVSDDKQIKGFFGKYRWLSNFTCAPILFRGTIFGSNENAFQAAKTLNTDSEHLFQEFALMTPERAKQIGRRVSLSENWNIIKYDIMLEINRAKYEIHPDLYEKLIKTGDRYIEETNNWGDKIWGVDAFTGEGNNGLGKILMGLRDEFQGYEKSQMELFI